MAVWDANANALQEAEYVFSVGRFWLQRWPIASRMDGSWVNRIEESMIDERGGPSTAGVGSAALCAVHPQRGPSDAVRPYVPSGTTFHAKWPGITSETPSSCATNHGQGYQ